jgi:hypothetical protein
MARSTQNKTPPNANVVELQKHKPCLHAVAEFPGKARNPKQLPELRQLSEGITATALRAGRSRPSPPTREPHPTLAPARCLWDLEPDDGLQQAGNLHATGHLSRRSVAQPG